MKRMNFYFSIVAALVSLSFLPSCLDGDDYYYWPEIYPNAVVTVKTADNGMYLQLDEDTTLLPANMTSSPFGDKEVRAFTNFDYRPEKSDDYDRVVQVNWIDSILTKSTVPFPVGENDDPYGSDPVEIADDWITFVEDGYLTLHLHVAWFDAKNEPLGVYLLTGGNPDDPYEVELRHDAAGDTACDAMMTDAYVAFRLDKLPDTEGKTVKLTLKWLSPRGDRSAQFDYRTRNFAPSPATAE